MMADPWTHMIKCLEPRIDDINEELKNRNILRPVIYQLANTLLISLVSIDIFQYRGASPTEIECIKWATQQLSSWPSMTCVGNGHWHTKSNIDADKFVFLFNLTWSR